MRGYLHKERKQRHSKQRHSKQRHSKLRHSKLRKSKQHALRRSMSEKLEPRLMLTFPLVEGFETGPVPEAHWTAQSTNDGQIRITDEFGPANGQWHAVLDADTDVAPWLLMYSNQSVFALDELGLVEDLDYVIAAPEEFAALSVAELSEFDVIYVGGNAPDYTGLEDDEDNNGTSDLAEVLEGGGALGRVVLTSMELENSLSDDLSNDLFENVLSWLRAGETTGLLTLNDPQNSWNWTPWSAQLNGHVQGQAGCEETVSIANPVHPTVDGLTDEGLSNWSCSYSLYVDDDIPGFETVVEDASGGESRGVLLARNGPEDPNPPQLPVPSLNEATLTIDLLGQDNVELQFSLRPFEGETFEPLPESFANSFPGDGVSMSADGVNWYRLFTLEEADDSEPGGTAGDDDDDDDYQSFSFDLDELAAEHGIVLGTDFQIKFQQYGIGPAPIQGIAADNILLLPDSTGPVVDFIVPELPYSEPEDVVLGDVNKDGATDIITVNSGATVVMPGLGQFTGPSTVTVLLGDGTGAFSDPIATIIPGNSVALVSGDFNGDTHLDVAVANHGDFDTLNAGVTILYGDSSGQFQGAHFPVLDSSSYLAGIQAGHLDNDNNLDIVVIGGSSDMWVLRGLGGGDFQAPQQYSVGSDPTGLQLADVNSDGNLDAIVASEKDVSISIRLGAGDGTFGNLTLFDTSGGLNAGGPDHLATGLLNADLHLDIVAVNPENETISLLFGNGDGTFQPFVELSADEPSSVVIADVDRDGNQDVVTSNGFDSVVSILIGDGSGGFVAGDDFTVGDEPERLVVGKLDAGDDLDIVTASTEAGNVTVLLNDGSGGAPSRSDAFVSIPRIPGGAFAPQQVAVVFDEVGKLDPVAAASVTSFELREAGVDGFFDSPENPSADDQIFPWFPQFDGLRTVNLSINPAPGYYRGTIKSAGGIQDNEGNPLGDLNGDGVGADEVVEFIVFETGPLVIDQSPARGDSAEPGIDQFSLVFSAAIDPSSFTVDDVHGFVDADGTAIVPTSVSVAGNVATIHFPPQTLPGRYALSAGPDILDLSGIPMNQNFNMEFGEDPDDRYETDFNVGFVLSDEDGFRYDIQSNTGAIIEGGRRTPGGVADRFESYVNAYSLTIDGTTYSSGFGSPVLEDGDRTVALPSLSLSNLNVQRRVYVPATDGNFARILDSLHNPTGGPITVNVNYTGALGSADESIVTATSSGDTVLNDQDLWFATDDGVEGGASIAELSHLLHDGLGRIAPFGVTLGSQGALLWNYEVTVPAGEVVNLLSFAIQTDGRAAAAAEAEALALLPDRAMEHLSPDEIATIHNFRTIEPADLLVSALNLPANATPGESIEVEWSVTNTGDSATSNSWFDAIYLSADAQLDQSGPQADLFLADVSAASHAPLAPGVSYLEQQDVFLPNNLAAGQWFVIVVSDHNENEAEGNELNNIRAEPITIVAPDLEVTQINAPATARRGTEIAVNWSVTNTGSGATDSPWRDAVYLSADAQLDPGGPNADTLLGTLAAPNQDPLLPTEQYTSGRNVTIPTSVAAGSYFLFLLTDDMDSEAELDEANNATSRPIQVTVPDLEISAPTGPATADWNETISVSWTVTNASTVDLTSGWQDSVFLSTDDVFD
ncbi:MAG: hypothetical protein ACI9G1_001426, partial [Pirellulaceae bacterium]